MDSIPWVQVLGVSFTFLINLAMLAYVAGTYSTRIKTVERDLNRMQDEVVGLRQFKEDMAVVKSELIAINKFLHTFMTRELD